MIRNKGKYNPFSPREKGGDEGQNRLTNTASTNPPNFAHPIYKRGLSLSEVGFDINVVLDEFNCEPDYGHTIKYRRWIPAAACPRLRSGVGMTRVFLLLCVGLFSSAGSFAATETQNEFPQSLFPVITYASIATESEKPTSEAPAVISVITAEDLHNHGITSLEQALEEIPGVYSPFRFFNGNFVFRGIRPQLTTNPEVLLLLDGIPQNDIFHGVLQKFITRIPIANIRRLEIIRGPGSAVYGADAFAGVINIITKTDRDYKSSELRWRVGSYDTVEIDGILKGRLGNSTTLLSLQARSTSGHEPLIEADAQTFFDNLHGTNASLAPDEANTFFDEANISLEFFTERWRTRFQARNHRLGAGTSLIGALTDGGDSDIYIYNMDVSYANSDWIDNWLVKVKTSIQIAPDGGTHKAFLPPGAMDPGFQEGILWEFGFNERKEIFDVKALYSGHKNHDIVLGAGFVDTGVYGANDARNFDILSNGALIPSGDLSELPSSQHFISERSRQIKYMDINDDWNFTRDFIFSMGARYDDYSDFGGTFNPRLALIWLAQHDLTAKFIANRAFRAPTFVELYFQNNPLFEGNPDLDPAIINTHEFVLEKVFFNETRIDISIYNHKISDFIETVVLNNGGLGFLNSSNQITGNGLEIELHIPIKEDVRFKSSYSYQINERQGETYYNAAPHNKIYAGIDWQFKRNWNLYTNILWVNDFTRDPADPRTDIGDSSFVGTVLRYTSPTRRWDTHLSIRNIFDEEAVSPSDDYRFLPNDYPLPGTNFIAEIRYRM